MLEYARVCSSLLEHARVCSSALQHARVCSSMLEDARVCSTMLEYAGLALQCIAAVHGITCSVDYIVTILFVHTRACSLVPIQYSRIHVHTRAYPRILYPRMLAHTCAYSRIFAHTRAYSRMLPHTHANPRIPAHTRAYPALSGTTNCSRAFPLQWKVLPLPFLLFVAQFAWVLRQPAMTRQNHRQV